MGVFLHAHNAKSNSAMQKIFLDILVQIMGLYKVKDSNKNAKPFSYFGIFFAAYSFKTNLDLI